MGDGRHGYDVYSDREGESHCPRRSHMHPKKLPEGAARISLRYRV